MVGLLIKNHLESTWLRPITPFSPACTIRTTSRRFWRAPILIAIASCRASGRSSCSRFGSRFSSRVRNRCWSCCCCCIDTSLPCPLTEETGGGGVDRAGIAGKKGADISVVVASSFHRVGQIANDLVIRRLPVHEQLVHRGPKFGRITSVSGPVLPVVDHAPEDLTFKVVDGRRDSLHVRRTADLTCD